MGAVVSVNTMFSFSFLVTLLFLAGNLEWIQADECHLTPVIHKLQYPGCQEKRIPSYACVGRCTSYVKVSGSKIWQTERSCMCCQESGERVAVVSLDCPNASSNQPRVRKMVTRAPTDCMCRPCTAIDDENVLPSEFSGYSNAKDMLKTFISKNYKK